MKTIGIKPILLALCVGILVLWIAVPASFAQGNPTVDCDNGESLQAKLNIAKPGWVITVSGTCNEKISIEVERVTLDGGGTWDGDTLVGGATIDGTGTSGSLVSVHSSQVVIRGFTIENSDLAGIVTTRGGSVTIQTNVIQNSGSNGVSATQGGYARIGGDGFGHDPDNGEGNIIRFNGNRGVNVRQNGGADIHHNKILNNVRDGIRVTYSGAADIDGNLIDSNGKDANGIPYPPSPSGFTSAFGIRVNLGGAVRLSGDNSHGELNVISNNRSRGLTCTANGVVDGDTPIFSGNSSDIPGVGSGCFLGLD